MIETIDDKKSVKIENYIYNPIINGGNINKI